MALKMKILVEAGPRACSTIGAYPGHNEGAHREAPLQGHLSLADVVYAFKPLTTNKYIPVAREHGWLPFQKRLWQRNYYERVIRDEKELNRARNCIQDNPMMRHLDRENPDAIGALPEAEIWEAVDG